MAPLQLTPLNVSGVITIGSVGTELWISFSITTPPLFISVFTSTIVIGPLLSSAPCIVPPLDFVSSRSTKKRAEPTPLAAPNPPDKTATYLSVSIVSPSELPAGILIILGAAQVSPNLL